MKKVSDILFAALSAAMNELPSESRAKIESYDAAQREWAALKFKFPQPESIPYASEALDNDPLARAAMDLRVIFNDACRAQAKK